MRALSCRALVVVVLGVFSTGCVDETSGPAGEAVSGTVTFKGQPLEVGSIAFRSTASSVSAESLIESGSYSISPDQGLVPGKYKVIIAAREAPEPKREPGVAPGSEPRPKRGPAHFLPPQYNSASTLTADVVAGKQNVRDFDLK
jgi:hypothetical protein